MARKTIHRAVPRRRRQSRSAQDRERLRELPLWPEKVQGGGLVSILERHVVALRDEAAHRNRRLFLDDVFIVYLLAFFNPTIRTLRTVEDFSQTRQAQKHLSTAQICRSTLSDFNRLADAERLQPIVAALRAELGRKFAGSRLPQELAALLKQVIAVDGTFLPAAADVAWAVCSRNQRAGQCYRARLDLHLDVDSWLPELIVVPDPDESEADCAARTIRLGAIHVYDRGFCSFDLMAAHFTSQGSGVQCQADFVMRLREAGPNSPRLEVTAEKTLDDAARAQGVVCDHVGHLAGLQRNHGIRPLLREIVLRLPDQSEVRLLTTLLDIDAELIATLYRYRWQVELFFRWLKCYAHFDHLISHSRSGVLLNFYVVVIGVMLMYLHTGYRPSKYLLVLLGTVAQGGSLEDILPIIRERERQCERDRQSAARRRAKNRG